jgi:hypothetical protein
MDIDLRSSNVVYWFGDNSRVQSPQRHDSRFGLWRCCSRPNWPSGYCKREDSTTLPKRQQQSFQAHQHMHLIVRLLMASMRANVRTSLSGGLDRDQAILPLYVEISTASRTSTNSSVVIGADDTNILPLDVCKR